MKDAGATDPTPNKANPPINKGRNGLMKEGINEICSFFIAIIASDLGDGVADSFGGGGGQVMLPSLITVDPRNTSSSKLTLMTPSF